MDNVSSYENKLQDNTTNVIKSNWNQDERDTSQKWIFFDNALSNKYSIKKKKKLNKWK